MMLLRNVINVNHIPNDMAGLRLPEHDHCGYCGDPIPYEMNYCDQDCLDAYLKENAENKKKDRLFYLAIGISLVAIVALTFILRL